MKVISSLIAVALCSASTLAHSYYFEDGFEGGDTYSTNAQGFSWGGDNSNAIFNSQGMLWKEETGTNDPPLTSFASKEGGWKWTKDSNTNWTPRMGSGSNFLDFIYSGSDSWAERRFDMGAGVHDIWISYWLRVPTNHHMGIGDTCGSSSLGDKFFALWQDGYSSKGEGSTLVWGMKPTGDTSGAFATDIQFGVGHTPGCFTGINDKKAPAPCDTLPEPNSVNSHFISIPEDRGRWMHLVLHARLSSSNGVADAAVETWRKWEGESYTKLLNQQNIQLHKQGSGFRVGYILGDSGRGYCEQTEWLIDDFIVSDKPLLSILANPKAPGNVSVTK